MRKKIKSLLLIFCFASLPMLWGQSVSVFEVEGMVTDKMNEPLVGVTVRNLSSGTIVATDLDGGFKIKAQEGDRLSINYLGMTSQEIVVKNNRRKLSVVMKEEDSELQEVVVTGYRQINSRIFVGSAVKISTEGFAAAPVVDVSQLLEGQAPGLNISSVSSTFGAAPKLNIRGGGSINGSVQPLWVVDGAIIDDMVALNSEELASGDAQTLIGSTIAGLNPADIESIEVLKDASATSLYGARGMNGVIVVTTKSGKRGTGLNVSYNLTTSVRLRPNYSQFDMMNAAETMDIYREMENKGYFSMNDALYGRRGGVFTQMYQKIENYQSGRFGLENTEQARENFLAQAAGYNTDWFKHLYKTSVTQNHTVSLSYGGENSSTYASISLFDDPGETIADKVNRFTAYLKSIFFLSDKVNIGAAIQANYRDQKAPGTFPRIKNLEAGAYRRDFDINPFNYALNTTRTLRPYDDQGQPEYYRNDWAPFNILKEYEQNYMDIRLSDFSVTLQGEWKPIQDLSLSAMLNTRRLETAIAHHIGEESNVVAAYRGAGSLMERKNNIYLYFPPGAEEGQVALPMGGIYHKNTRSMQSYLGRISADYLYNFDEAHQLKAFSFAEIKKTDVTIDNFSGYGIGYQRSNSVVTNPLIFQKTLLEGENYFGLKELHDRNLAFSGSLMYSYQNRYIVNLVGNYEGSNLSGSGASSRWLPTWNIGTRWNIDGENFFKPFTSTVDKFAFRAGYGLVAKMNSGAINSRAVFDNELTFRRNLSEREYAIFLRNLENRDLTWEKMYELNMGVDLGFYGSRYTASVDFYIRNSFDLIDQIRTSAIGGEYIKWANFGDMRTTGLDVALRSENIRTKDFSWATSLNLSFYNQEITRLINKPSTFDLVSGSGQGNLEGFPRGALYSFSFRGLTDRGLPTFYFGSLPSGGTENFNISGASFYDVKYNTSYLVYEGATEPNFTGGLANNFKYKNWQLGIFLTWQAGNKIRISPTYDPEYGDLNVFSTRYRNRWRVKGDEQLTNIPIIPGSDIYQLLGRQQVEKAYNTYNYSDVNVVDGSFIRLKSVSLTYTLPPSVCQKLGLKSAAINTQVRNPLLIYADPKLNGRDPEYINAGGVSSPTQRTYSVSFNVNF